MQGRGRIFFCLAASLGWSFQGWSQGNPRFAGGAAARTGAGSHATRSSDNGVQRGVHGHSRGPTLQPFPGRTSVSAGRAGSHFQGIPGVARSEVRTTQPGLDPGFAFRLGNNVGLHAIPPVAFPPGVGNINQPGLQPLPTGQLSPVPNINFPGGVPTIQRHPPAFHPHGPLHVPGWKFRGRHFKGQGFGGGTVIVPYYVPYVVYGGSTTMVAVPPAVAEPSAPQEIRGLYDSELILDYAPPGQPAVSVPEAQPLTLLAFKDSTLLAVVDYWLEGDMLWYESRSGLKTVIPLDRLDLPLTQQLNRERNVRFVLEARP